MKGIQLIPKFHVVKYVANHSQFYVISSIKEASRCHNKDLVFMSGKKDEITKPEIIWIIYKTKKCSLMRCLFIKKL